MGKQRFFHFDLKYLSDLASKEESFVTVQHSQYHFVLHPWHFNNFSQSIRDHLNKGISSYDEKLDGILLGYKNLKLMSDVGRIHGDACFVHYDIAADFFIFKPEIGRCLTGTVIKKSKDHVTCLVYNCFTISIPRPKTEDSEESWIGDELTRGMEVQIKIERINLQKMSIKGSILKILNGKPNRKIVFDESPNESKTKKNVAKQLNKELFNTSKNKELLTPDEDINHDSSEENSIGSEQGLNIECENLPESESRVTPEVDSSSGKEEAKRIETNNENSSSGISSQQEFTDQTIKQAKVEKKKRRKSLLIQNDDQIQELSNVSISTKQQSSGTSDTSELEKTRKSKGKKPETCEQPPEKIPHVSGNQVQKKQKTKKTSIKTIAHTSSSEESNEIEEIKNIEVVNVQEYETEEDFAAGNVSEGDEINIGESQEMDTSTKERTVILRNAKTTSSTWSQDAIVPDTKKNTKVKKERRSSLFVGNSQDVPLPSPEMVTTTKEHMIISSNANMSSSTCSQDGIVSNTKRNAKVKKERRSSMFVGNLQEELPLPSPELDTPTMISRNTNMSSSTCSQDETASDTKNRVKVKKEKKISLFNEHKDSKSDIGRKRKCSEAMSSSESEDKISPKKSKKLKTSSTKSSKTDITESQKSDTDFEKDDIGKEQLDRKQMKSPEQNPVKMMTEKVMLKSKVKLKAEKHSSDDNSHKKSKKKKATPQTLEDTKEQILNQLLKVKKQELKVEEDYSDYTNMQIKQEEISLPDLDMDAVLESTKLEDTSLKNSFISGVELSDDFSLDKILALPLKLESGRTPKKKKKVKKEKNDDV